MNAWNEPDAPNPVAQIIATRTAQVGGVAGVVLTGIAPFVSPGTFGMLAAVGGVAVTVGLSAYFVGTFNPRTRFAATPLLIRLSEGANAVALTFDDGPHPDTTPRLLDALANARAKATFFVVGERVSRYPAIVRRIADDGHTIGIHGLRHRTMVLQNASEIERDLTEAVTRIEAATGKPLSRPVLLRPPYGFKTATLVRTAHRLGFQIVAWSLDPRDYDPLDEATMVATVTAKLAGGDIVLLHERPDKPVAVNALPRLLELCRERGLTPTGLVGIARESAQEPFAESAERGENHQQA